MDMLERGRPEELGIPPEAIERFLAACGHACAQFNSFMIVRHGKVAFEVYYAPFAPDLKHNLYSCSKSFTATAVGFAVAEGRFRLEDRVVDLLPDKLDRPPHPFVAAMTVEHLLKMATAYSNFVDPVTNDWTREFLNAVPDHYPGTLFGYDTSGTHTLCAIVQRTTGQTMLEYMTPRLFEPLGIRDVEWEMDLTGVHRGGGGVRLTTESMAKFGILYLNRGDYFGHQVLPKGWAEAATSRQIDNANAGGPHETSGYGYQFWVLPRGHFACMGLGGQLIVCTPDQDTVFVSTANNLNAGAGTYIAQKYFYEYIYPALSNDPLPQNDQAYERLGQYARAAQMPLPEGKTETPLDSIWDCPFTADANALGYTRITLCREADGGRLVLEKKGSLDQIPFGTDAYIHSMTPLQQYVSDAQYWGRYTFPGEPNPRLRARCASKGCWTDARTLVVLCHLLDTVQSFTITCYFGEPYGCLQIKPFGVYTYDALPVAASFRCDRTRAVEEV